MKKIIDLTHTFTRSMSAHPDDEPASLKQVRMLEQHQYNDWKISSGMHAGTHIDGPGHLTNCPLLLSNVPVDRFVGRGYLVDARNRAVDPSLLQDMPRQNNLIVLIFTGSDKKFGTSEYFTQHPIISTEFAHELVKRNITMIGFDFFSPDTYPFAIHHLFFKHDILIIENLTNLESLLGVRYFTIIALPLKTETDSSLARVIAVIE